MRGTLKLDPAKSSKQKCDVPGWDMSVEVGALAAYPDLLAGVSSNELTGGQGSSTWNNLFGWCNTSEDAGFVLGFCDLLVLCRKPWTTAQ